MKRFCSFAAKVVIIHTVTYFVFGVTSALVNDYASLFQQPDIVDFMRPIDSKWMMFGPLMQPLRGLLYAAALWPFRPFLFSKKRAWLYVWGLFVAFSVIGTSGAAPSSMEGIIYTQLPLRYHMIMLPEILLQTLAFSWILVHWDKSRHMQAQPNAMKTA